ncbi:hypothetical protein ABZZ80_24555 [Streptomyces sp. NPDC006356]
MHQLAAEPQGDLLSGGLGRELDALPAEADVAVPADQRVDLHHERGLRPVVAARVRNAASRLAKRSWRTVGQAIVRRHDHRLRLARRFGHLAGRVR